MIEIICVFVVIFGSLAILLITLEEHTIVKKQINDEFKRFSLTPTNSSNEKLGKIGEEEVSNVLHMLPRDKYVVIDNLLYLNNNRTHQIDHVVVSNYGIFIIETKNYSGSVYGSDRYNTWYQYLANKRYTFLNPVLQNYGHVKALESKIPEYKDYFVPIVCFTNKSKLNVKTKSYVIQLKDLLELITSYNTEVLIPDINLVAQNLINLSIDMPCALEHHSSSINKR